MTIRSCVKRVVGACSQLGVAYCSTRSGRSGNSGRALISLKKPRRTDFALVEARETLRLVQTGDINRDAIKGIIVWRETVGLKGLLQTLAENPEELDDPWQNVEA